MRIILAMLSIVLLSACGVNSIPTAEEAAKARWADVEVQLQRRNDLIPNVVKVVKASSRSESDVLVRIAQARSAANRATLNIEDLKDPAKMEAFSRIQNNVGFSLQRMQEAYPELQSQKGYRTLMAQIEGTENRLMIARNAYNDAVLDYNTRVRTFPESIGAKLIHGAKPMVSFKATSPGALEAPDVAFD